jgi:drug/metabolite transporter (DMT)-like permease
VPASGNRRTGLIVGLFAALGFSTSGPAVKPLLEAGWSPGGAMLVRLTLGAVLLLWPALHALGGRFHLLRDEWRVLLVFGVLSVGCGSTFYYLAVDRLPIAVALLIEYMAPLLLLALAWLRTRHRPPAAVLAGAALAAGGLVMVLDVAGQIHLDTTGLVFAWIAAFGNASYWAVTAKPLAVPPVTLAGTGMVIGAATVGLLGLVHVLPVVTPAVEVTVLGTHVSWVVPILVVGTVPTAISFGISAISVRMLGERVASFVGLAEVLFAVVLAWLLLGEAPLAVQIVGAVLVVAGVALVRRGSGTHDDASVAELEADDELAVHAATGVPAAGLVVPLASSVSDEAALDRLPA